MMYPVASIEATAKTRDHSYVAWIKKGHVLEIRPNEGTNKTSSKCDEDNKRFHVALRLDFGN